MAGRQPIGASKASGPATKASSTDKRRRLEDASGSKAASTSQALVLWAQHSRLDAVDVVRIALKRQFDRVKSAQTPEGRDKAFGDICEAIESGFASRLLGPETEAELVKTVVDLTVFLPKLDEPSQTQALQRLQQLAARLPSLGTPLEASFASAWARSLAQLPLGRSQMKSEAVASALSLPLRSPDDLTKRLELLVDLRDPELNFRAYNSLLHLVLTTGQAAELNPNMKASLLSGILTFASLGHWFAPQAQPQWRADVQNLVEQRRPLGLREDQVFLDQLRHVLVNGGIPVLESWRFQEPISRVSQLQANPPQLRLQAFEDFLLEVGNTIRQKSALPLLSEPERMLLANRVLELQEQLPALDMGSQGHHLPTLDALARKLPFAGEAAERSFSEQFGAAWSRSALWRPADAQRMGFPAMGPLQLPSAASMQDHERMAPQQLRQVFSGLCDSLLALGQLQGRSDNERRQLSEGALWLTRLAQRLDPVDHAEAIRLLDPAVRSLPRLTDEHEEMNFGAAYGQARTELLRIGSRLAAQTPGPAIEVPRPAPAPAAEPRLAPRPQAAASASAHAPGSNPNATFMPTGSRQSAPREKPLLPSEVSGVGKLKNAQSKIRKLETLTGKVRALVEGIGSHSDSHAQINAAKCLLNLAKQMGEVGNAEAEAHCRQALLGLSQDLKQRVSQPTANWIDTILDPYLQPNTTQASAGASQTGTTAGNSGMASPGAFVPSGAAQSPFTRAAAPASFSRPTQPSPTAASATSASRASQSSSASMPMLFQSFMDAANSMDEAALSNEADPMARRALLQQRLAELEGCLTPLRARSLTPDSRQQVRDQVVRVLRQSAYLDPRERNELRGIRVRVGQLLAERVLPSQVHALNQTLRGVEDMLAQTHPGPAA